ncbi:MAG: hypothetical protein H7246_05090 [Phycisphaerae bacterium]|nr:hypothetical protein [Saprospiraceae bacterium]
MLRTLYFLITLCLCPSLLQAQSPVQQLQNLENLIKQQEAGGLRYFAPNLYQKSRNAIEALRKGYEKTGKIADPELRASKTAFDLYSSTAERTRQIMDKTHQFHVAVLHHNFARNHDAKAFYKAKKDYDEAIVFGEKQKFDKVAVNSKKAQEGYKKLLKQAQQKLKSQIAPQLKKYEAALSADMKALKGNLADPGQVGPVDGVVARVNLNNFGLGPLSLDLFDGNDPPYYWGQAPDPPGPFPSKELGIIRRDPDALRIEWHDRSNNETGNRVLRSTDFGIWETISELGVLDYLEEHTYTDPNLQPSTNYGYRIETYNAAGPRPSLVVRAYTRDTAVIDIWRLQLRVKVAPRENADTEDEMSVIFNDFRTNYLDYGVDDFERDRGYQYDLMLDNISQLSDIVSLRLRKNGSDRLFIDSIVLLANNNRVLFSRSFVGNPLDLIGSYDVSHDELRGSPEWQQFVTASYDATNPLYNIPFIGDQVVISNAEIVSRIEGLVGHMIHADPAFKGTLKWGGFDGPAVEANRVSNTTLHVDLDLERILKIAPDLNVDVDFDLVFSKECVNDSTMRVNIVSQNITTNSTLGSWLTNKLIDWFGEGADLNIDQHLELPLPDGMSCDGMRVSISEDGELIICCF